MLNAPCTLLAPQVAETQGPAAARTAAQLGSAARAPAAARGLCSAAACAPAARSGCCVGGRRQVNRDKFQTWLSTIFALVANEPSRRHIAREPLEDELCLSSLSSPLSPTSHRAVTSRASRSRMSSGLRALSWRRRPAAAAPGAARSRREAAGRQPTSRDRPACATLAARPLLRRSAAPPLRRPADRPPRRPVAPPLHRPADRPPRRPAARQ
jgi:hypothetical protein